MLELEFEHLEDPDEACNQLASATVLGIGAVAAAGLTVANASSGDDGPEDDGADTAISGEALQQRARRPSTIPEKVG